MAPPNGDTYGVFLRTTVGISSNTNTVSWSFGGFIVELQRINGLEALSLRISCDLRFWTGVAGLDGGSHALRTMFRIEYDIFDISLHVLVVIPAMQHRPGMYLVNGWVVGVMMSEWLSCN